MGVWSYGTDYGTAGLWDEGTTELWDEGFCDFGILWDYIYIYVIMALWDLYVRLLPQQHVPCLCKINQLIPCRGAKAACYGICNAKKKGAENLTKFAMHMEIMDRNTKRYCLLLIPCAACAGFR